MADQTASAATATLGDGHAAATDARRGQILRAALEIIAERGFSDTRVADVADRAEVSSGLVIYYFKTKDQLLTEAMRYSEDAWYEEGARRMAAASSAAKQLEEIVSMTFLTDSTPTASGGGRAAQARGAHGRSDQGDGVQESWALWLDLWALSVRNGAVAAVRREFDEHWRETIRQIVRRGIAASEFSTIDVDEFAIAFSALLDGLAVQVALQDPVVDEGTAVDVALRFAGDRLGFERGVRRRRRPGARPRTGNGGRAV